MTELDAVLRYSELLILYRDLLSDAQKEILDDYFCVNLSISEIAENRKTSRSAVEDAVKKGKNKLDEFEDKIGSLKLLNQVRELKAHTKDKEIISKLDEMERTLRHGI